MDIIILTENETERDKWVAIIEELQKAIRSKQITQVSETQLCQDTGVSRSLYTYISIYIRFVAEKKVNILLAYAVPYANRMFLYLHPLAHHI